MPSRQTTYESPTFRVVTRGEEGYQDTANHRGGFTEVLLDDPENGTTLRVGASDRILAARAVVEQLNSNVTPSEARMTLGTLDERTIAPAKRLYAQVGETLMEASCEAQSPAREGIEVDSTQEEGSTFKTFFDLARVAVTSLASGPTIRLLEGCFATDDEAEQALSQRR